MGMSEPAFRWVARALGAGALVVGTAGMAGVAAAAAPHAAHAKKPVVLQGHTCTVIATKKHPNVVGHAGDVVCGISGNDILRASGPGRVFLVAGPRKRSTPHRAGAMGTAGGNDTLIASPDPGAQDILIGGSGADTLETGGAGDDVVEAGSGSETIDCSSSGTITITGAGQQDQEDGCQGANVESASLQFEGTVTALDSASPPATLTMTVTDPGDGTAAWLAANPACGPTTLVVDLATAPATIEVDGGGPLVAGADVEVEANAPVSGCSPVAVSVQAG